MAAGATCSQPAAMPGTRLRIARPSERPAHGRSGRPGHATSPRRVRAHTRTFRAQARRARTPGPEHNPLRARPLRTNSENGGGHDLGREDYALRGVLGREELGLQHLRPPSADMAAGITHEPMEASHTAKTPYLLPVRAPPGRDAGSPRRRHPHRPCPPNGQPIREPIGMPGGESPTRALPVLLQAIPDARGQHIPRDRGALHSSAGYLQPRVLGRQHTRPAPQLRPDHRPAVLEPRANRADALRHAVADGPA